MRGPADAIVHLDDITKRFGKTVAVETLNLTIARGEFVTFLGPSGCGKSTTLRMIGGFERPDKGRIILDGQDVTRLAPNRRPVNMVFQDYALFPHMTVAKNMAFGLELQGRTKAETEARVSELLGFLQLEALRERMPDQLSGGQRQRVALARSLAPAPKLLLLDEPLGALDAKLRGQLQVELKDIQRRTGKTFLFVTHDQDEALTMSDRIVVMNAGRVEQDGTPEELYFRPQSRFVAEFIGETNLFSARVVGVEGKSVSLDWHGARLEGVAHGRVPAAGKDVTASLRLEKVAISAARPEGRNVIEGRLTNRIFKGSRNQLEIAVEPQGAVLRAYVEGAVQPNVGETVFATFEPASLSILDD